jgi:hypothetical protein
MLVKSVTLPSIKLTTETANQYNRKKVVQTTHKFEPVTIKFHDDNMGLISKVWQNYYRYYYADPTSAGSANSAYSRNATKRLPSNAYGLDNKSAEMFFNHITVYQLSRKEYFAYKLINPYIQSFDHQTMDYAKISSIHELSMVLTYEAVHYSSGLINSDVPEGFGSEHYDQTPSPLQNGFGGVDVNAFSSLASMTTSGPNAANGINSLNTVINQINNFTNTAPGIIAGVSNLAGSAASVAQNNPLGTVHFAQSTAAATTLATPINIGP